MKKHIEQTALSGEALRALLLACIGLVTGTGAMIVVSFSVLLVPMSTSLGMNRTKISAVLTIVLWSGAAIGPFLARLMDKIGIHRVLVPSTILFGLATASLGFIRQSQWQLYGQFLLVGLTAPSVVGYAKFLALWFKQRRGLTLTAVPLAIALAATIFPRIAQLLLSTYGWRGVYLGLGMIILLIAVPASLMMREPRKIALAETIRQSSSSGASLGEALHTSDFWLISCCLGLVTLCLQGVETHLVAIAGDRGIASDAAIAFFPAISIGTLFGQLSSGYLLDRFDTPRVVMFFAAISLAGILLFQNTATVWVLMIACAMLSFGAFGELAMTPYLLTRYFGLFSFASIYAINFTVATLFFGLSPIVSGAIFDLTGSYRIALMLYAGLLALTSFGLLFLRPYSYDSNGYSQGICPIEASELPNNAVKHSL